MRYLKYYQLKQRIGGGKMRVFIKTPDNQIIEPSSGNCYITVILSKEDIKNIIPKLANGETLSVSAFPPGTEYQESRDFIEYISNINGMTTKGEIKTKDN